LKIEQQGELEKEGGEEEEEKFVIAEMGFN